VEHYVKIFQYKEEPVVFRERKEEGMNYKERKEFQKFSESFSFYV
jgi:hypothetical protein